MNVIPDNIATLDHAFNNRVMAERFLFTCYSYMPNISSVNGYPAFHAGRECWVMNLSTSSIISFVAGQEGLPDAYAHKIALGLQNANNPLLNFWDGGQAGINTFTSIRQCNIFLENIHKTKDLPPRERTRWIAEVKFLKAFYHYYLLRSYGPIPIVDENIPVSASPEEVRVYREPVEKVAEYIVSLLDEAAADLEPAISNVTDELGRATKTMALALKAKLLTLMASPMFNGNPYYLDMKDNRGINLFPMEYDPSKWQAAADAIKEAIDCAHDAGCALYYHTPTYQISDATIAKMNIRGAVTERWNKEIIWGATRGGDFLQGQSLIRTSPSQLEIGAIGSMLSPTLDVVERFYSNNGVPIQEDNDFDYENRYKTNVVEAKDRYYMKEGFETANLHFPDFDINIY